jgi:phosphate transport system substrate-binding protein
MHFRSNLIAAAILGGLTQVKGESQLPAYQPEHPVAGIIRSWGSEEMGGMLMAWEQGFRRLQPDVAFADTLKGSETAQAGLYTGVADLALMGREYYGTEWYPLFRRKAHFPTAIEVATGSYNVTAKSFALAVLVNKSNPLTRLSLAQLDGIFGEMRTGAWDDKIQWHTDRARSASEDLRTWGQLGLMGDWATKPIHVHGFPATIYSPAGSAPGAVYFFQQAAMHGSDKWNSELQEHEDPHEISAAVASDPYAIGYTCLGTKLEGTKAVALASAADGKAVELTPAEVASRRYPLARAVYIYIDRNPGEPVDPKVKEFLRYVLSREGQQAVSSDGQYLPLTGENAAAQLKKIN